MVRRLLHYFLDSYGTDREITKLVNTTELWFVPVANPDGYDFTFEPTASGCGARTCATTTATARSRRGDGVDLNRNYAYKWGYDNEGSSPDPASETYRGPAPDSEPETQGARQPVQARRRHRVLRQLPLGRRAAALRRRLAGRDARRRTTCIYEAMAGDDANPAVPGYDPDISAELYTTNGETDSHMQETLRHARLHAGDVDLRDARRDSTPTTQWDADDCGSVFNFPDDEALIQAEFEKNIPFALAVAESAKDPDDPVSVGRPRRRRTSSVDSFDVSYGDPQTVAVTAKRALKRPRSSTTGSTAARPRRRHVHGVEGRRALRRRERPLLRRVPRRRQGHHGR